MILMWVPHAAAHGIVYICTCYLKVCSVQWSSFSLIHSGHHTWMCWPWQIKVAYNSDFKKVLPHSWTLSFRNYKSSWNLGRKMSELTCYMISSLPTDLEASNEQQLKRILKEVTQKSRWPLSNKFYIWFSMKNFPDRIIMTHSEILCLNQSQMVYDWISRLLWFVYRKYLQPHTRIILKSISSSSRFPEGFKGPKQSRLWS